MKHCVVSATEFKAKCLSMLDDIENGFTFTVTKRGLPVAKVGPANKRTWKSPEGALAGKFTIPDELLEASRSMDWQAVRERDRRRK